MKHSMGTSRYSANEKKIIVPGLCFSHEYVAAITKEKLYLPSSNRCLSSAVIWLVARRAKSFSVLYLSYKTSLVWVLRS